MNELVKTKRSLKAIQNIVDSFYNGKYTITTVNNDFDITNHIYDIRTIMGMISNNVYQGLGLDIPSRKGEQNND